MPLQFRISLSVPASGARLPASAKYCISASEGDPVTPNGYKQWAGLRDDTVLRLSQGGLHGSFDLALECLDS